MGILIIKDDYKCKALSFIYWTTFSIVNTVHPLIKGHSQKRPLIRGTFQCWATKWFPEMAFSPFVWCRFIGRTAVMLFSGRTAVMLFIGRTAVMLFIGRTAVMLFIGRTAVMLFIGRTAVMLFIGRTAVMLFIGRTAVMLFIGRTAVMLFIGRTAVMLFIGLTDHYNVVRRTAVMSF